MFYKNENYLKNENYCYVKLEIMLKMNNKL